MELQTAIRERRSIRKFKTDEVPKKLILEIFEEARWSPSWGNTQSWEFHILSGKKLTELKEMNREKTAAGVAFSPDIYMPEIWPPAVKARYMEVGKTVLTTLGIKREDKKARNDYNLDMVTLFSAPCLILACNSRDVDLEYPLLDIGLITQTICLLAYEKGLGTCIMAAAVRYADAIRKIAEIPTDKRILLGIALGYPAQNSPVNNFARQRMEIDEFVHFPE